MKRLWLGLIGLVVLACALFPSTALAYGNADFHAPGSWLGKNTKQHNSFEPLNVVISARSDRRVVNDPTYYLAVLGFTNCFGGQNVIANVGQGYQNQAWELRDGGCSEVPFGGNHLRGWKQQATGAWFLAVSEEGGCAPWGCHIINPNGFNQGRDDFASKASVDRYAFGLYKFHATIERSPTCPPGPPRNGALYCAGRGAGNTDGRPYDGQVVILTVTQTNLR